jgi:ATP-dependent protease HslVU (ClpYQ) ATPase subunit
VVKYLVEARRNTFKSPKPDAARLLAFDLLSEVNRNDEDTGARRLVSILDTVLEEISFEAPEIYQEFYESGKAVV